MRKSITGAVLKVFWVHLSRYRGFAFLVLVFSVALGVLQVATPWFYKEFFDVLASSRGVVTDEIVSGLIKILLIVLALKSLTWLARRAKGFTSIYVQARVMAGLTETAFSCLVRHSHRFFADNFAGSLTRKVNRLSHAFEVIADQVEFSLIPLFVTLGGILFVLFRRHYSLGAVLLVGVLIFFIFHIFIARWKLKYDLAKAKKDSETTGVLADALVNSTNIKLFSSYSEEESLFHKAVEALRRIRSWTWRLNEWIDAVQGAIMVGVEFLMLYLAIRLWQRGFLTVGDFVLIQIYLLSLFDRLWEFGRVLRRIYEGLADAAEIVEILQTSPEIQDSPDAGSLAVKRGEIEFRGVDFYFHHTRKVLDNFNLKIRAGEKVALVGSSGAGKSTVVKLLLRLYDVARGEILIDGQNIVKVTQDSLRNCIALVPQEPILFHRTLKENIRYGRTGASDEEVREAARKARSDGFISLLPSGYDTYVGERGVKLSGGERQRVAIARAILKNAPMLVLDEATSSLDSESEALIQDAMRELMRGKTAIIIAHRLSTIMQMDRIVVMDEGGVVSEGTHQELLAREGIYKTLWDIQAGGFLR